MPILEDLKEYGERATGLRRPRKRGAPELVRVRKPRLCASNITVSSKPSAVAPNHLSQCGRSRRAA
jgi:hypothetical protein